MGLADGEPSALGVACVTGVKGTYEKQNVRAIGIDAIDTSLIERQQVGGHRRAAGR